MNIQGKDCTLTVARDCEFIPLPYSEETVRQTSKGYSLPCVIGKRNRDKFILSKKAITGCFVTRLDYNYVEQLFLLLFYDNEVFNIYTDRIYEKVVYKNLTFKSFELRVTNGDAFKFHLDIKETQPSGLFLCSRLCWGIRRLESRSRTNRCCKLSCTNRTRTQENSDCRKARSKQSGLRLFLPPGTACF